MSEPTQDENGWREALGHALSERYATSGAPALERLSGGASRTTWRVAATAEHPTLFLQCERSGGVPGQVGQRAEAAVIRAAGRAGVPAPTMVLSSSDHGAPEALGEFMLVHGLPGVADPAVVLRSEDFAPARARFATDVAQVLARLHRIDPATVPELPVRDPLVFYRDLLDRLGEPHPALELGLTWLESHRVPSASAPAVVHGDFRVGNLLFSEQGITGVLDWEMAHLGDPAEDLGWLCVASWRFGGAGRMGGMATVADVLAAYHAAGGDPAVTAEAVHWWEVLGTFKWAVICVMQAAAHLDGSERSVELAALGRRTASVERDLLDLIGVAAAAPGLLDDDAMAPTGPHDAPGAAGLMEAVREFIAAELLPELSGRTRYLTRVALRALETGEREVRYGPLLVARHEARLADLGVADDAELAAALRSGRLTPGSAQDAVAAAVADKLLVSDPRRLPSTA
jgi:aminoglycoside phosphotransferase (APT) family kinase protein